MYRMFLIYFMDYKKFNVKRNRILEKFYLYKCFAYLPYKNIDNFSNNFFESFLSFSKHANL